MVMVMMMLLMVVMVMVLVMVMQSAYNSGKHGNLREFVNFEKLAENSGNLKFTQGIYHLLYLLGIELCA